MHRLDQRRLAHAARAPQQRVVGRQPAREALGVLDQHVAHAVDALEQRHLDAIDLGDRDEPPPVRMPGERVGGVEIAAPLARCGASRSSAAAMRSKAPCGSAAAVRRCGGAWRGFRRGLCVARLAIGDAIGLRRTLSEPPAEPASSAAQRARIRPDSKAQSHIAIEPLAAIVRADFGCRNTVAAQPNARRAPKAQRDGKMFVTPAFAQASPLGGDSMLMQLLPFVLIFVIMYFLILRPQQKRAKEHQELVKNLRRGDTVITSGGLVGKVTKVVDDDQIEVEIADGVRVRQMRSMVSGVRAKGEPVKDDSGSS